MRFLHAKGNNPTEIHSELTSDVMSKIGVYQWCSMFEAGRSSIESAPGSGRPQSSLTQDNIARVDHLIREDRRRSIKDLSNDLDLPNFPSGETVNANRYCQTLDKLREAIRRKRPGRLSKGVILQHDNAAPHTAKRTQDWLKRYNWETLPHPPHSPDLAPSDIHLFGPLKRHLAGQRFEDDDDLIEEVTSWLRSLDKKFLRDGIYSLVQRWKKCLDLHGDYVEK